MIPRWGKADRESNRYHLLAYHCADVAAVLAVGFLRRPELLAFLSRRLGMHEEDARALLLTAAALHDIGKVGCAFQKLRRDVAERLGISLAGVQEYRRQLGHDLLGHALLRRLLRARRIGPPGGLTAERRQALLTVFGSFTGHHGRPPTPDDSFDRLLVEGQFLETDLDVASSLSILFTAYFGWNGAAPSLVGAETMSYLLNGIASVVDWLGSNEAFEYLEQSIDLATYWQVRALPTAEQVIDTARAWPFEIVRSSPPKSFDALFAHLKSANGPPITPTPLQSEVDEIFSVYNVPDTPLLVIIEDHSGSGKTEAADLIAHRLCALGRADGLYAGLPTMATADAAWARKQAVLEGIFDRPLPTRVLAHSRAFRTRPISGGSRAGLETVEDAPVTDWLTRSSKRALLAGAGIGTVDQALIGALRTSHCSVRLAGLWHKVLVVDEVHAYDDYMQIVLRRLVRHQALTGQSTVLLSATLPSRIRMDLLRAFGEAVGWPDVDTKVDAVDRTNYPLLTVANINALDQRPIAPNTRPRPHVRFIHVSDERALDEQILAWLGAGRSAVYFRNTVDEAVAAWGRLALAAASQGFPNPLLYHARFLPRDRERAEKELLKIAGKGAVPSARRSRLVVATQAAEQSLDLDFDEMASDLAPADSIIQRLGRRRRHPRQVSGLIDPEGIDRREKSLVLLNAPSLDDVSAGWYQRFSRGASVVYPDDARLWLGLQHFLCPMTIPGRLDRHPDFSPDADARALLESVYASSDEVASRTPVALHPRHYRDRGNAIAEEDIARRNTLAFEGGLIRDWHAQAPLPEGEPGATTRLGERYEIVLLVEDEGVLQFVDNEDDAIESSTCRAPRRLRASDADADLIGRWVATQPRAVQRRLSFCNPLVFRSGEDGILTARAVDGNGVDRLVAYSSLFGLSVRRG
jgi:CRISPR-associated endonuclease/helicase Cas3